jgi:translocation and assembly module TamB
MSRIRARLRKFTKYLFFACLLFVLFVSALLWYITTDSFQNMVRGRLVAAVERATGGRAELGSFHVVPLGFQLEVRDLTIHGREAPGEIPLIHIDSLSAVANLSSVLGARIAFHSLSLRHPVVHVIFYPDGTTNQPSPRQTATDFEHLFSIGIDRLNVEQGELLWQDQPLPLQFVSNDISASLDYSFLHRRYSGNVSIGKAETQFAGLRPVAWSGQANFSIGSNAVEIRSWTMSSERSRLQVQGTVTNFRNPTFKGKYDVALDLSQAANVSRDTNLKSGTLEFRGEGAWSRQSFSSAGNFDLDRLSWQDKTASFKNASAAGKFSLDPQKVLLSQTEGRVFGGAFTSEAEISNWQTAPKSGKREKGEQRGTIKFKLKDVSLSEILVSLGPPFRPVNQLKFAGNISGTSELRWIGSIGDAEIVSALDVSKPNSIARGEIPLTANVQGTYGLRGDTLQLTGLSANTPSSQLRAAGALSSASALRFSFVTSDLREWQPLTAAIFTTGVPFAIDGNAAFNGSASGKWPNLSIAGNLQIQNFETSIPVKKHVPEQVHWDSLSADMQLSPRNLSAHNVVLRNGSATIKLDGSVGLISWNLAPESLIHVRVDAQNANAGQLARLAQFPFSLRGQLNGNGDLTGTASKPEGQGTVSLSSAEIEGHPFDSATMFLQFRNGEALLENLQIVRGDTQVSGAGSYDFSAQTMQLNVTGTNFDLAEFSPLEKSRIRVDGKLDFSAQASGSTAQPNVNAHLHFRNVTLNEETAGDYLIDAVTNGPDLRLTGHSDFKSAQLLIEGNIHLRDLWPARINLHFTRLDVDSFLESYLHGHITGHSAVAGDLLLEGPLRNLQQLHLSGNVTDFFAEIERVKIRNDGPLRFALTSEALKVDNFHIVGENTDFSAGGSMQFTGQRALDFSGRGTLGLHLVQTYDPDLSGSGTLIGEATVSGTLDMPLVKVKLQIQNGALSDVNLPSALTEMNGTLTFSQNQISIQTLTARTGGGTVNFTGRAQLVGNQINFDLGAEADSVRLRYPPGVSSAANAIVRWTGNSSGSLLSGDITVTKMGVTPGFDFGAYLERTLQSSSLPQTDPVLNKIRLDLHVVTAPELQMQTSVLRLRGEADLHVRGSAAKPVLLGRADIFEGEAYFTGTKYRLERGGVTFTNPAVTTPFLDLEATTRVRDYDITLSMTGPADKPKLNYRSEPPLPPADIITLLAFGQTSETSAQLQQTNQSVFSQQASSAMLSAALNATLNNRTQRLFGNSSIKIDPQGLETETSPTQTGPAVTIEQQVKNNLTIAYTTAVAQTTQQIIRAEYNVSRNVSVVAIRDQYGVVSFDVKIRRRKR